MLTRLILLSPQRERPSSYLTVDSAGVIVERGVLTTAATRAGLPPPRPGDVSNRNAVRPKGDRSATRTVLIVPGTEIVTRWLDLEDGPPIRVAEAASALLKDHIGASRDTIHIALGEPEDDGSRPVSVVDRSLMQTFDARAAELGVTSDVVIPDHLMLSPPEDGVLEVAFDTTVAVRGQRLAFTAEDDLASLLIGSRRRTVIDDASVIENHLAASSKRLPMNLLQQDFTAGGRGRGTYRRMAAFAALAALSPLVIWAAEIARNESSARVLETRAEIGARSLIGNPQTGDPIRELRGRLAGLRANDGFMQTTAALFDAVSRAKEVELEGLSYLEDGVIRATLVHNASSDVTAVRASLEQSGITVDEDAPGQRDHQMVTIITLGRLP